MKILNLYACLGGNRYKWGNEHSITAVELDPELARMYSERFPDDKVVCGDAHKYLLEHFTEYDFIWSSPPCHTHSRLKMTHKNKTTYTPQYADMALYQEIILLDSHFEGRYVVENVVSYYEPLIPPQKRGRHYYWANFRIPLVTEREEGVGLIGIRGVGGNEVKKLSRFHEVDISSYKGKQRKDKILRNLVDFEVGRAILEAALGTYTQDTQHNLFSPY